MLPKKDQVGLINYLLGYENSCFHSMVVDKNSRQPLPQVSGLLSSYLHDVNRFLFDGGIQADITNLENNSDPQAWLNRILTKNRLDSTLYSLWSTAAIYGDLSAVIFPSKDGYVLKFFNGFESTPRFEKGELVELLIVSTKLVNGESYQYRLKLDSEAYTQYPLVKSSYAKHYDWEKNSKSEEHKYGFVPAELLVNNRELNSNRGASDFDYTALRLACSAIMVATAGIENAYLFGNPILVSPDPDDTLSRLRRRIQVFQKESSEDGGGIDLLTPASTSATHLQLLADLSNEFRTHMGVSQGSTDVKSDTSSLTLRLINASTISVAENKWQSLISEGLEPVLNKILKMASVDNFLPTLGEENAVFVSRKKPYFSLSPRELQEILGVVESLVNLGVNRVDALKEYLWPHLSKEEIEEKINNNFEDLL